MAFRVVNLVVRLARTDTPCLREFCSRLNHRGTYSNALHLRTSVSAISGGPSFPMRIQSCSYTTKKEKKKNSKKDKNVKSVPHITEEQRNAIVSIDEMKRKMDGAIAALKDEYGELLAVRTSAGALDNIKVRTNDGTFPLIQIAQIHNKSASMLVVNMASMPQYVKDVQKALFDSPMNLNPQQEGNTFFIQIPKVTREHREKMAGNARGVANRTKKKITDLQNQYIKELKKKGEEHSQDLVSSLCTVIMAIGEEYSKEANTIRVDKQYDILKA